ncbi:MAG: flagellar biosynthesis protein FlhB [Firmicutes bacterium]|nr:flagellar biosynthesis protein FlhB [Bacillota bacterium]
MLMFAMPTEDKTEKPTPQKRKQTREEGQVLKSNDVSTAFSLIVMFSAIKFFGGFFVQKINACTTHYLTSFYHGGEVLTVQDVSAIFLNAALSFFITMIPILSTAAVSAILINYLQIGFLLSPKALQPKFSRINPFGGLKKIFSMRSVVELLKSAIKATVIIYFVYKDMKHSFSDFPTLVGGSVNTSLQRFVGMAMKVTFKIAVALLVLAAFDYLYQWWEHQKVLKMTKQEVKEEHKQTEGDPKVKGKIRQLQMKMGMTRMMNDVPSASVVITNPTHYAVALKYDQGGGDAPIVLAKGVDYVALQIKKKAKEHKVEIIENKPLARALFETVEIGDEIPQDFYVAVAQILADIYNMKK